MTDRLVLVVEDDPVVRLVARKQLMQLGYGCEAVDSGERALECFRQDIAVILMDVGLPGIDGIETTMIIREREEIEGTRHVPIIAYTAESDKQICLSSGMDDYLQKPVSIFDLKDSLEKWMQYEDLESSVKNGQLEGSFQ
jgi:CheY-like chemotaxis protein